MISFINASKRTAAAVFLLIVLQVTCSDAQQGDRNGHNMKPPPAHWKIPDAPVLSPEKAMKSFAVEDGFSIELVASEPMVNDPVAIAFDGSGRMWVAEMRGYMPDIEGKTELETPGRISIIEDTNNDGKGDKHTVFLQDVLLPRALSFFNNDKSLLFADNESLFEIEILIDDKGNITPGEKKMVDEKYASGGNPEHKANGLLYGLDNWLYNTKSSDRYRRVDGKWIKEKTESRGQWGIAQDNYGRIFSNTNSNLISAEEIPPGTTIRNPHHDFSSGVTSKVKDQRVWPSRITPGVNRGYMDGVLTKDGYLAKPTAVSGLAFYRGDQFPAEYIGNLFIPEPSGNLVKRLVLSEKENGFREIKSAYEGKEFFTSTDERSRIVDAFTAPDGTLYLLDMYRGIIQHKVYMTSFLRAQVEERKLDQPVDRGRIWRVVHNKGKKRGPKPNMAAESSLELVAHLSHPNGWWRDTAQRLIIERGGDEATSELKKLISESQKSLAKIHAMWTLEGLQQIDAKDILVATKDKDPRVVAEAVRVAEALVDTNHSQATLMMLSKIRDTENVHVKRQLAATLGQFAPNGNQALATLLKKSEKDNLLIDLAISGSADHEMDLFKALPDSHPARIALVDVIVKRNKQEELTRLLTSISSSGEFHRLSKSAVGNRRGDLIVSLLDRVSQESTDEKLRSAAIKGMLEGGKKKGFKSLPVKELHSIFASTDIPKGISKDDLTKAGKLFKKGSGKEIVYLKTDADKKQYKLGETHYQRVCLGCHQIHGKGQQFLAPPLVDSEWVSGSKKRLVALVMDGMQGPIEVAGKLYKLPEIQPLMPGLRANTEFTDEQLAAIMTYVRNAWGNGASPVSTREVSEYRKNTEFRAPFTADEAKKIK